MRFPRSLTLLMAAFCFAQSPNALAEETELKPAVPLLDSGQPGQAGQAAEQGAAATLKGTIEHHAHAHAHAQAKPKLRPAQKAKVAAQGPLSGGASSGSSRPAPLSLRADYTIDRSIGIIGIRFRKEMAKPPTIEKVFQGTPAAKVGLMPSDSIVAVDGVPTYGLSREQCFDLMIGVPDTPITLSVLRQGNFAVKEMQRMDFNQIPDPAVRKDYLMAL